MGGLVLENHWQRIVLATTREFLDAEDYAALLWTGTDGEAAQNAAYDALRRSMVASIFLHHFSEVAANRQHPALRGMSKNGIRRELAARSVAADQSARPDDAKILGEVADAIKHGELTAHHICHVARDGRVIEWTHGAPSVFVEGRQNNEPQIIVTTGNGTRSLRAILQNLCDTWSSWLGLAPL